MFTMAAGTKNESFHLHLIPPGGIFMKQIGEIYRFKGEFAMNVKTKTNVTADLELIKNINKNFTSFCTSIHQVKEDSHCQQKSRFVEQFSREVRYEIHGIATGKVLRFKRQLGLKQGVKTGLKKASNFLARHKGKATAGAIGFQEYRLQSMQEEIYEQTQVAAELIHLQKLEQEEQEKHANFIEEMQHREDVKEAIDAYSSSYIELLETIQSKYLTALSIDSYGNQCEEAAKNTYGTNIHWEEITRTLEVINDTLTVRIDSLIGSDPVKKLIVISTPLTSGQQCKTKVAYLAMDNNTLLSQIKKDDTILRTLAYHENDYEIQMMFTNRTCEPQGHMMRDTVIKVTENVFFVFIKEIRTSITCNNVTTIIPRGAYEVTTASSEPCIIEQGGIIDQHISVELDAIEEPAVTIRDIEPITMKFEMPQEINKEISNIRHHLEATLDKFRAHLPSFPWNFELPWWVWPAVIVLIWHYLPLSLCQRNQWLAGYNGPAAAPMTPAVTINV
jgi:hypothetical protein